MRSIPSERAMPDIAFAGVVICRLHRPDPVGIDIDIFHRNQARAAIYSIGCVGCSAESVSGHGFPPDVIVRDACRMPADRGARKIHRQRTPFGGPGYALKR